LQDDPSSHFFPVSLSLSPSIHLTKSLLLLLVTMEPWADDLADDLQSISFTSTATTSTTTLHRSTSSGSSSFSATLTPAPSAHPSKHHSSLSLADLRFSLRLGSGDIGSVYLTELKTTTPTTTATTTTTKTTTRTDASAAQNEASSPPAVLYAAKVMDKKELVSRSKEGRARTEMEILEMLDHPFLPSLFAAVDSPRWLCLLTEFCPGGDLHVLRQRQPLKRFEETAVRFYASEVVVALEYLHMMGIVYRDLKPENVLVRADGHIMLTDFDLSLKCDESSSTPQIITGKNPSIAAPTNDCPIEQPRFTSSSCILPNCIVPAVSCFHPRRKRKKKMGQRGGPEFVAEPMDVRSMSFVGTHEYLAPEIVSGEGHGSPVDWWSDPYKYILNKMPQ
ncbi:hypothetical protein Tsubulata_009009, partial [Turnera subulata]